MKLSMSAAAALLPLLLHSTEAASRETRAIDGDSLVLDGVEIRLWGVDAPEWDEHGGSEAHMMLGRLLSEYGPVACVRLYKDRYGRAVSRCTLSDGRDLGCALISSGVARDYERYSGGAYKACAREGQ